MGAAEGGPLTKSAWDPAKLQLLFALGVPPWLHLQKRHLHVVIQKEVAWIQGPDARFKSGSTINRLRDLGKLVNP